MNRIRPRFCNPTTLDLIESVEADRTGGQPGWGVATRMDTFLRGLNSVFSSRADYPGSQGVVDSIAPLVSSISYFLINTYVDYAQVPISGIGQRQRGLSKPSSG